MKYNQRPKVGQTLQTFSNAILRVSERLTEGQGGGSWEGRRMSEATPHEERLDSLSRHLMAYLGGHDDEDHLTAFVTNGLMILEVRERERGTLSPID